MSGPSARTSDEKSGLSERSRPWAARWSMVAPLEGRGQSRRRRLVAHEHGGTGVQGGDGLGLLGRARQARTGDDHGPPRRRAARSAAWRHRVAEGLTATGRPMHDGRIAHGSDCRTPRGHDDQSAVPEDRRPTGAAAGRRAGPPSRARSALAAAMRARCGAAGLASRCSAKPRRRRRSLDLRLRPERVQPDPVRHRR